MTIAISKVHEELEFMCRAVLHEVNEGIDSMNKLEFDNLEYNTMMKLNDIENNLCEILRIMSR